MCCEKLQSFNDKTCCKVLPGESKGGDISVWGGLLKEISWSGPVLSVKDILSLKPLYCLFQENRFSYYPKKMCDARMLLKIAYRTMRCLSFLPYFINF